MSEESKKELIDLGLDLELVDAYFRYKDEITDLNKNTETYYKKIDGTIIGNIENKSLKPKKLIVLFIINLISLSICVSYVLIKEYNV